MTRTTMRAAWAGAAGAAVLLLGGCPLPKPLPPPMTLEQVVEKVNSNNELLPWFKARFSSLGVTVRDEHGWPHRVDMFGYLIYAQPMHLYLNAFMGGEPVMGMAGNREFYGLWIRPYFGRGWIGHSAEWDPPGHGAMPINPRQLTRLLGVDAIPRDLGRPPWAVLRTSDPADRAHIIQFVQPIGGRTPVLVRELWVNRDSNLPSKVVLFDRFGQPVVESTLSDWRMVTRGSAGWFPFRADVRSVQWKRVPGGWERAAGSRLQLTFVEVEVDEKFSPANAGTLYEFHCPADLMIEPLDEPGPPATDRDQTPGE